LDTFAEQRIDSPGDVVAGSQITPTRVARVAGLARVAPQALINPASTNTTTKLDSIRRACMIERIDRYRTRI
jgi:hypothetical protein